VAAKGNPYSLTKGLAGQVAKESTRAAAIGEGAVMAGQGAENIREQNPDGLLTPMQS